MHNNIDELFKNKLEGQTIKEVTKVWNKNASWERLHSKRKKKKQLKFYYYAAAVLIIGLLITGISNINTNNNNQYSENEFAEYQKRQKLKEIEAKMSGSYIKEEICFDCDNMYYIIFKENRSVKPEYVDIFN